MKFLFSIVLLASIAAAAPAPVAVPAPAPVLVPAPATVDLEQRQSSNTRNELEQGSASNCPDGILIFARGSTEGGNIGATVGADLAGALKGRVSSLWVQGVGGPYAATIAGNLERRGSPEASISEGVRLINLAASKCPGSAIVAGGYSQGAALIAAAISDLSSTVRGRVTGATVFGYTKNLQNGGRIPNFPASSTRVYCAFGDLVCDGQLIVAAPHFTYGDEARGVAAIFLAGRI